MTTSDWPQADPGLERAYHRLLRAYPRDYRRRHGAEVVTTLLEMAAPGQRRPDRADARHLIVSGLRHRFRLPAGRPLAWVAAVLVTLIGGAFGAAAGSWAVEQAVLPAPDGQAAAALHRTVVGAGGTGTTAVEWDPVSSPWGTDAVGWSTSIAAWDADAARHRLAADGWALSEATPARGITDMISDGSGEVLQRSVAGWEFTADRDGVRLDVTARLIGSDGYSPADGGVTTTVAAAGSAALVPAIAAGGVFGLVAGWLVAAATARRVRRLPAGRARVVTTLSTAAVLVLALPVVALYGNVIRAVESAGIPGHVRTVHSAFKLGPYWPFGPFWLNLALLATGLALGVAAVALTATPPPAVPAASTQPQPS